MLQPHIVLVLLRSKPGCAQDLLQALLTVQAKSLQETGCLMYKIYQDNHQAETIFLYEMWQDAETHKLQFSKDYIQAFAERSTDLLAQPFQVHFAQEVITMEENA